ncbi:XkdX family protein [Bacillus altitudinis]|nr:XkdX family protein [Bacillus altitudinis]
MQKSKSFESLKMQFSWYWVRPDQLRRYAELGVITHEEFEEITGENY